MMVRGLVKRIKSVKTSIVLLRFSTLLALAACSADQPGSENGGKGGHGYVSLALNADTAYIATKASSNPENADEYDVRIYKGEDVVSSFRYGERPDALPLEAGDYVAKASWGTLVPAGFDALYVAGETKFNVADGLTVPVKLDCKPQNAKVTVDYTEELKSKYSDYSVSMGTSHTGNSPLVYAKDEARPGYFQVNKEGEKLNVNMLFTAAGKEYPFTNTIDVQPRDFVRLHLKLNGKGDTPTPDPDPNPDPDPDPDDTEAPTLSVSVTGLLMGANENLANEITVTSNVEWTIANSSEWLTVEKQNEKAVFTAKTNTASESRMATVTLTATNESKSTSVNISVFQQGKSDDTPKLYVDIVELTLPGEGFQQAITVRSSHDWTFSNDAGAWLTASRSGENNSILTLSAEVNAASDARKGTITLTASNVEGQTSTVTIQVTQKPKEEDPYIKMDFSNLKIPAEGMAETGYKVETNMTDWSVSSSVNWLKAQKENDKLFLLADKNTAYEVRSGILTLIARKGEKKVTVDVEVTQGACVPPVGITVTINRDLVDKGEINYTIGNKYSMEKKFSLRFTNGVDGVFPEMDKLPKDFYVNITAQNGAKIEVCEWVEVIGFQENMVDLAATDPGKASEKPETKGLVWDADLKGQTLATIYLEDFVKGLTAGYHEYRLTVKGGGATEGDPIYSNTIRLRIQKP